MFDVIFSVLQKNYQLLQINGKGKSYFIDENGLVVASYEPNNITLFFRYNYNDLPIKGISVVKDFNVNGKLMEVAYILATPGTPNDVKLVDNFYLDNDFNHDLVNDRGNDVLVSACGSFNMDDEHIGFDICSTVFVDLSPNYFNLDEYDVDDFNLFILSTENKQEDLDYDKVYSYHRKKNDWYYSVDSKAFADDIARTEKKKTSNVDNVYNATCVILSSKKTR